MNKNTLHGDWNIIKGKVREKWGKLTDDDLSQINGKRDQLLGHLEKKYGLVREKAESEVAEWEKWLDHCKETDAHCKDASCKDDHHAEKHSKTEKHTTKH